MILDNDINKVCVVGAGGKLGRYMIQFALARGYEVVAVCRQKSVKKLDEFKHEISIVAGETNNPEVVKKAIVDCDAVLTVLLPWSKGNHASGTARAVLDYSKQDARLIFSSNWNISKDGQDVYPKVHSFTKRVVGKGAKLLGLFDLEDQAEAARRIFWSNKNWTVVRASGLEEGESEGLPVWSRHVGDPVLESKKTRRIDFALFMVEALKDNNLIHEAPAIVSCKAPSALRFHRRHAF